MSRKITKRLMLLIISSVIVLAAIIILVVRSSNTPSVSADVLDNGKASDQLKIRGSLPPLE